MTPRLLTLLVPAVAAAVVASSACGGSTTDLKTLDCAWATSQTNCWKATLSAAKTCLPADGTFGTLSADMTTCTFADGKVVTFDPAITIPPPDNGLSFTVTSGGSECLVKTEEGTNTKRVKTSAGTFEQTATGMMLVVTCPDGSEYSALNALDLTKCNPDAGMSLDYLPGDVWSWSGTTSVSYAFLGGPGNESMHMFTCQKP